MQEELHYPNYYEYTLCRLVEKKINNTIERIRRGKTLDPEDKNRQIVGTDEVLSIYANSAKDLDITPLDDIEGVDDGYIVRTEGGFNIYNSDGRYFLFKQYTKKGISKSESDRLSKLIKGTAKIETSKIEDEQVKLLIESGLTRRAPYSKEDFAELLYDELKKNDDTSKKHREAFLEKVGKPTKSFIKSMSFSEMYYAVEERLKMGLFSPFIESGYELQNETQYRMSKGISLETILGEYKDQVKTPEVKEITNSFLPRINEIIRRLDEIDDSDFDLSVFIEKSILKEELIDISKKSKEIYESVSPSDYDEKNGELGFFDKISIDTFICPEKIDEKFTKRALETSSNIININAQNPTVLRDLGVDIEEKKVVSDYGVKIDLKNLLLYARSLVDITKDSLRKKKKVDEIEKRQKDGSSQGFSL